MVVEIPREIGFDHVTALCNAMPAITHGRQEQGLTEGYVVQAVQRRQPDVDEQVGSDRWRMQIPAFLLFYAFLLTVEGFFLVTDRELLIRVVYVPPPPRTCLHKTCELPRG